MESRELVKRTLEFRNPERTPRHIWMLPWAADHYPQAVEALRRDFPDDIVNAPSFLQQTPHTTGDTYAVGTYVDEWGCIFENRQKGVIGEVKEPMISTWDDADRLRLPEAMLSVDREQVNRFCAQADQFVMAGCCPRPFERLQFLRTSENVFIDIAENGSEMQALLARVHDFYLKEMEVWASTDVDGMMFMDDWGSQRSLLISPRSWRRLFKPLYQAYIDLAHHHGKFIFMHSDGYILDILPDLVEMGLDSVNSQLFAMDIEKIGEQFAGKITFWGEIDRQYLLSFGSRDEVAAAVRRVRRALRRDGGVIAQCEFGAGAKPENVVQVFQTWQELDQAADNGI
jgi:hypothetical protein